MKKVGYCLIILAFVLSCVMCGFLWGRSYSSGEIQLSGAVSPATAESNATSSLSSKAHVAPKDKVNVNTATSEELCTLPGIGPVLAQSIINYRQQNGPFTCVESITAVDGIGQDTLEDIMQYITVGGSA